MNVLEENGTAKMNSKIIAFYPHTMDWIFNLTKIKKIVEKS